MPAASRANGKGKAEGEDCRPDETGEAANAVDRALQLSLLIGLHVLRHEALRGWAGESPEAHDGDAKPEEDPGSRQAEGAKPAVANTNPSRSALRSPNNFTAGFTSTAPAIAEQIPTTASDRPTVRSVQ